jgi:glutamyl-tRNA reductase
MLWRGFFLHVGVLGMNFKTAPLSLLEQAAKGSSHLSGERALFFKHSTIVLSTCSRTEIYFSAPDLAEAQGDILSFLRLHMEEPFEHRLYSYFGVDALMHLCRVTAGLDSAILAETEIQRQVKVAYGKASAVIRLPSSLHYVFQKGFKIAKEARSRAQLDRGEASLYGTLWNLGAESLGDLKKRRILLVGYSEINRGFASFLLHKGISCFFLCTTRPEQVQLERAIVYGREALNDWPSYDLIVCASQSVHYLIAGEGRGGVIFDLSVPRNVDPRTRGVKLMNIEQIHQVIEKLQKKQREGIDECEAFIEQSALRLSSLYRKKMEKNFKTPHVLEI